MKLSYTLPCAALVLSWLVATTLSAAQSSGANRASAEALFGEGVSLVAAGEYESGCHKFEASQALDATLGTELRLADCYERAGKPASAWATFKHAAGIAHVQGQTQREELARERVAALEPKLSYLTLSFEGQAPTGLVVQRNGAPVPLASLGVAVPVDPGPQRLTVSAPEHEGWQRSLEISDGPGKTSLSIPALARRAAPPTLPISSSEQKASATSAQRTLGIVSGAVGLASLLAGGGLGLYAKSQGDRSKLDEFCPNDNHNGCNAAGVDLRERARGFGTASTVTFVVGAALLTTGIVLFSTAPSSSGDQAQARLQFRAAGTPEAMAASVRGTW